MAGTGQFNEIYPIAAQAFADSTYTPNTLTTVTALQGSPARIDVLLLSNSDTVARVVEISMTDGTDTPRFGQVSVPGGSGYGGVAAVDALAALLPSTQQGIVLPKLFNLTFLVTTAPAATKIVTVSAYGGTL